MIEKYTEYEKPVSYICSPLFEKYGVRHMFTRRRGGVSKGAYESFNFASGSGVPADSFDNVVKNHALAASVFGMDVGDICRSYQTHSSKVRVVGAADRGTGIVSAPFPEGVDGLVCAEKGVLLSVRGADCATVLLYDTKNGICGACHSGWRGTVSKIAAVTVRRMCESGSAASDIIAAIGPSARSCCYRVNEDVRTEFTEADSEFARCFEERDGFLYLDMQGAIEQTLLRCGLKEENISDCGECTVCDSENYFSHRRSGVLRGTMAAFITA